MKKSSVQKAKVALIAYGAATTIAGLVISEQASAASTACSTQGTSTAPVKCGFAAGTGPLAQAVSFTGSNDVSIFYDSSTTDFAVCASHSKGNNSYGYTLGGKVNTVTGATGGSASLTAGCS